MNAERHSLKWLIWTIIPGYILARWVIKNWMVKINRRLGWCVFKWGFFQGFRFNETDHHFLDQRVDNTVRLSLSLITPTGNDFLSQINETFIVFVFQRPFVCIEANCGRSFAQVTNLNNHMKTHHKIQQYVCNQCPKKFTQVRDSVPLCNALWKWEM